MLSEKQVEWTQGFRNTASEVGQLGFGLQARNWLTEEEISERLQGSSQDH